MLEMRCQQSKSKVCHLLLVFKCQVRQVILVQEEWVQKSKIQHQSSQYLHMLESRIFICLKLEVQSQTERTQFLGKQDITSNSALLDCILKGFAPTEHLSISRYLYCRIVHFWIPGFKYSGSLSDVMMNFFPFSFFLFFFSFKSVLFCCFETNSSVLFKLIKKSEGNLKFLYLHLLHCNNYFFHSHKHTPFNCNRTNRYKTHIQ